MGKEVTLSDRPPQRLWETALGQLELKVTRPNFETWLRGTIGLRFEEHALIVGVPSDFALEWLRTRMNGSVSRLVSELAGRQLAIQFEVIGVSPQEDPPQIVPSLEPELPAEGGTPAHNGLTFDTFAVTKCNRLAARAAKRFIEDPASPQLLVLWSATGLGRSHLLNAIAHECASHKHVALLTSGESFVTDYTSAVRAGRPHAFSARFQHIDVLLLDDLQFLATRKGSQEQFFHTLNTLQTASKRIVVALDGDPRTFSGFSQRLLARLIGGLCVRIDAPDPEDRFAILKAKRTMLPDVALRAIAARPAEHVRALEGALHRTTAYIDLTGVEPTPRNVETALHPFQPPPARQDYRSIVSAICARFQMSAEDLSGPSRARDVTYARHLAMYLLQKRCRLPYSEIGRMLGGRDHSTVLSGCRRISREIDSLPSTKDDILAIDSALESGAA
jgi:chromosomal replication initiator protein